MAVVKTTRLNLAKQLIGDPNWDAALDTGFDDADARLFQEGTGSPEGVVASDYDGQRFWSTDETAWYTSPTAATTVWRRDTPLYGTKAVRDALAANTGELFLRSDISPGGIDRYNGASWDRVVGPFVGQIEMWSGSVTLVADYLTERPGWALCAGALVNTFQTPDLTERMVVGYSPAGDTRFDAVREVGGDMEQILTAAQMREHRHLIVRNEFPAFHTEPTNSHVVTKGYSDGAVNSTNMNRASAVLPGADTNRGLSGGAALHASPYTVEAVTAPLDIPAYMALAFIVFVDVA